MTKNSHSFPAAFETADCVNPITAHLSASPLDPDVLMSTLDVARARFRTLQKPTLRTLRGQVMTPSRVAQTMLGMLDTLPRQVRLLDAGAGMGMLSLAFVSTAMRSNPRPQSIHVTAYETDPLLQPALEETLVWCDALCGSVGIDFSFEVISEDFIVSGIEAGNAQSFTHAVMNPPYGKLPPDAPARTVLRKEGLCAANWYAGFMGVALKRLGKRGLLIALTPRSYCNGVYFKKLRQQIASEAVIRALHLYDSRRETFADDGVLQEVLILKAEKDGPPGPVRVTSEAGLSRMTDAEEVVSPTDPNSIIRIATQVDRAATRIAQLPNRLSDLGLSVSTGRVLLHKLPKTILSDGSGPDVPVIHAQHLIAGRISWPLCDFKKQQTLRNGPDVAKLVLPAGTYVLVKRISGSEAPRRVEAAIYEGGAVAIDNHVNVIHCGGAGMSAQLAQGLTRYLNSDALDGYVRSILGGTQVNASDLRQLRYPDRKRLEMIACGARSLGDILDIT